MAETVALVASILGIAAAATKLSIGLYEIARGLKDAGQEVRVIADDTNLFSRVLKELSNSLKTHTVVTSRARDVADDLIHVCATIHADGEQLLLILQPLVEQSRSRATRVFLRVRWLFKKSKFAFHREMLQSLKSNLQLLMSVITIANESDRDAFQMYESNDISLISHLATVTNSSKSLIYEVQSLRHTVESGIRNMEDNLRSPTMYTYTMPIPSSWALAGTTERRQIQDAASANIEVSEYDEPGPGTESQGSEVPGDQLVLSDREIGNTGQDREDDPHTEVGPLALVPYFRVLFVQEKVCRLARDALSSAEMGPQQETQAPNISDSREDRRSDASLAGDGNPNDSPVGRLDSVSTQENDTESSVYPSSQSLGRVTLTCRRRGPSYPQSESSSLRPTVPITASSRQSSKASFRPVQSPPAASSTSVTQEPQPTIPSASSRTANTLSSGASTMPNHSNDSISMAVPADVPPASSPSLPLLRPEAGFALARPSSVPPAAKLNDASAEHIVLSEEGSQRPDPDVIKFQTAQGKFQDIPFRECETYDVRSPPSSPCVNSGGVVTETLGPFKLHLQTLV